MRSKLISVLSFVGLIFAFLVPAQPALSDGPVTKTVTVRGTDGTPYSGALVSLVTFNHDLQGSSVQAGHQATTDSSGVAVLSLSATTPNIMNLAIVVQPRTDDLGSAVTEIAASLLTRRNQSFEVQFEVANAVVDMKLPTSSPSSPTGVATLQIFGGFGSGQATGFQEFYLIARAARPGPLPVRVDPSLPENFVFQVVVTSTRDKGFFSNDSIALEMQSGVPTFTDWESPLPTPGGITPLLLENANVFGTLLPAPTDDQYVSVSFVQGGDLSYESEPARISTDGAIKGFVPNYGPGEYQSYFYVSGPTSATQQSFRGPSIFVNEDGHYSSTSDGSYVSPNAFNFSATPPSTQTNFRVESSSPAYLNLISGNQNLGPSWSPSGDAGWLLADGTYTLSVTHISTPDIQTFYDVLVADGFAAMALNGTDLGGVDGPVTVYNVDTVSPNLLVEALDPSGEFQVAFNVDVYDPQSNQGVANADSRFGVSALNIPVAGTYELVVDAYGNEGLLRTYFNLVATEELGALSFTITPRGSSIPVVADSDGYFALTVDEANLVIEVTLPNGDPFQPSGNNNNVRLDAELQKLGSEGWEQHDWLNSDLGSTVRGQITEAGTYRVRINVLNDPSVAQVITAPFTVTGPITPGQIVHSSVVALSTPNFLFDVTFGGQSVLEAQLRIESLNQSDNNNWIRTSNVNGRGAYFFEASGDYRLSISPTDLTPGASQTTFMVNVDISGGQTVINVPGSTFANGAFQLPLSVANFVVRPFRTALVDGNLDQQLVETAQINLRRVTASGEQYVAGAEVRGGLISLLVNEGNYVFELQPGRGVSELATRMFRMSVDSEGNITSLTTFEDTATQILSVDGIFRLEVVTANVIGRVVKGSGVSAVPLTESENAWVDVELQVLLNGEWRWADQSVRADSNGRFAFYISEPGQYRLKLNPFGFADVSTTTFESNLLNLTDTGIQQVADLGDVAVGSPVMTIRVELNNEVVRFAGLEIRQGDDFIDWTGSGPTGQAGIGVDKPGTYEIVVHPPYELRSTLSRKTYTFVVNNSMQGSVTGVTPDSDGVFVLTLSLPSLKGQVLDPDGNAGVRDAQVVAVDTLTNQALWERSANTDDSGFWSMSLPAGTYQLYARAPWGNIEFGDGPRSGVVTVSENGSVQVPAGRDAAAFNLSLSAPAFSGFVVEPGTSTRMTNVQVCLIPGQSDNNWYCASTNQNGEWALSPPAGFTDFDLSSELVISEWGERRFAENRIRGVEVEILLAGGNYQAGQVYAGIEVSPAAPNFFVTVTAGNSLANRVWVSVDRPGVGWIGGAETGVDGVARIFVPSNLHDSINVQVGVENNAAVSSSYASTRKTLPATGLTTLTRSFALALEQPNLRGVVRTPGITPQPLRHAWVEIFDDFTGDWFGGASTNAAGEFSIVLPTPAADDFGVYRLQVNAPWNFTGNLSKRAYYAVIDDAGAVTIFENNFVDELTPVSGLFSLTLSLPSVVGVVKDSNGNLVRDSWVTPLNNANAAFPDYMWESGTHTRQNGEFSMALPTGDYLLEANPAWNSTGSSRSARCEIEISSDSVVLSRNGDNVVISPSCWNTANSRVELTLRAPNVKFKLVKGSGANQVAVPFANVGVGFGSWHTWTQSDLNGDVALYIDAEEIAALNPQIEVGTLIRPRLWFEPPFGTSDLVRWECEVGDTTKPVCGSLDAIVAGETNEQYIPAPGLNLGSVAFPEPNTRIRVSNPTPTGFVANAWVGLMIDLSDGTCTGNRSWIGGANTDSSGFASFNLESTTATYCLEVNAPWNQKNSFAPKSYVATQAQMDGETFALAAPNLKITLLDAESRGAKWSWIGVEEVVLSEGSYNYVSWINGAGTDNQGNVSLSIPEPETGSKFYRITGHPGGGVNGSRVSCVVEITSSDVVSAVANHCTDGSEILNGSMTLTLSSGNVTGVVFGNGAAIAGAIVAAVGPNGQKVTTVTNSSGHYKLQLDAGISWSIKVFAVSRPGQSIEFLPHLSGTSITPSGPMSAVSLITLQVRS